MAGQRPRTSPATCTFRALTGITDDGRRSNPTPGREICTAAARIATEDIRAGNGRADAMG